MRSSWPRSRIGLGASTINAPWWRLREGGGVASPLQRSCALVPTVCGEELAPVYARGLEVAIHVPLGSPFTSPETSTMTGLSQFAAR